MRASRLLSILILLQLRSRLTAEDLACEFEVSVRTIYRDIDALSAAGVPVYGDRGPGGGFQLLDGYRTRLTGLNDSEAEAMLMIGLPEQAAALGIGDAAKAARNKLLAALPAQGSADADRVAQRFHVDTIDWYRAARPAPFLAAIARAVLDQKRIAMTYESWSATRDWIVEPLGLVMKAGGWYLVATGHEKTRIFNISDVKSLISLEEDFARPAGFDLPGWWARETREFEARLRPETARLRVSPVGLARLRLLGAWAADAAARASDADAQGWLTLDLPIESVEKAAPMLLGLGPEFEVVAPDALARLVRTMARAIAERA
jgi:predicted DNA-binding transcriptional regulator YafY